MTPMTPQGLRKAIDALGLTQVQLADALGMAARTIRKYLNGDAEIPSAVAMIIRAMLQKPKDWEKQIAALHGPADVEKADAIDAGLGLSPAD